MPLPTRPSPLQLDAAPPKCEVVIESLSGFAQPQVLRKTYDLLLTGRIRPTERWAVLPPRCVFRLALRGVLRLVPEPRDPTALRSVGRQWQKRRTVGRVTTAARKGEPCPQTHFQAPARYGSGAANNLNLTLETIDRLCGPAQQRNFAGPSRSLLAR